MDDLDAVLAELPDDAESQPAADAGAQPESTDTPTPALKLAELDAVVPDSPDIDENFRGKPIGEVLRVSQQLSHEIGVARKKNQEFNALQARAQTAEGIIEWMRSQQAPQYAPPQAQQRPEETDDSLLERLSANPTRVLPEKIREVVAPMEEELRQTRETLIRMRADTAREQARAALNIPAQMWEAITPDLAAKTAARGWNIEDPRAWYAAGKELVEHYQTFFAPPPQQQRQAAPVEVPRPAPPPAGGARSTSRPASAAPVLKPRVKEAATDLLAGFGIKPDSPAFNEFAAFVANRKETD